MIKIKDFTLASKHLVGTCPRALLTSRPRSRDQGRRDLEA